MPIQKDRSKDLPGKTGYSHRDAEKIMDVIRNPGKHGVDPNDTGGNKPGCPLFASALIIFGLLAVKVGLVVAAALAH